MSFIDDSEKNIEKLMKEVSGGSVAGFVGSSGMAVDQLFAGAFHPDSGHGSKNKQLLKKQLKDRRKKRDDIESSRDGVIDDYSGLADPVGGYYDMNDAELDPAYEELDTVASSIQNFNINNTPEQEFDWIDVETNLEYDEPGEPYKKRVLKYDDNSYNNPVVKEIEYDDNSNLYADDTYINKSATNWQIIDRR